MNTAPNTKYIEKSQQNAVKALNEVRKAQSRFPGNLLIRSAILDQISKLLNKSDLYYQQQDYKSALDGYSKCISLCADVILKRRETILGRCFITSAYLRKIETLKAKNKLYKQSWKSKKSKNLKEIKAPALFDTEYYSTQLAERPSNLYKHYHNHGWRTGLNPHALFNVKWYLANYPDVRCVDCDPLDHYLRTGWRELRNPHPLFNTEWYLSKYGKKIESELDPLTHYVKRGWRLRFAPNPDFNVDKYLQQNPYFFLLDQEPLQYYLQSSPHTLSKSSIITFKKSENWIGALLKLQELPFYKNTDDIIRINFLIPTTDLSKDENMSVCCRIAAKLSILCNSSLRIITYYGNQRDLSIISEILALEKRMISSIQYEFVVSSNKASEIDIYHSDIFLTSNYELASAASHITENNKIFLITDTSNQVGGNHNNFHHVDITKLVLTNSDQNEYVLEIEKIVTSIAALSGTQLCNKS